MQNQIETFLSSDEKAIYLGDVEAATSDFLFPGSFNPLHDGHLRIAEYVQDNHQSRPAFEISVSNVDKPTLDAAQIQQRLSQFENERVWLTRATTFAEKAKLFSNTQFIVGADTVARLFDARYYRDEVDYNESLQTLEENACRFLAFGRLIEGTFHESSSVTIPEFAQRWFDFVPQSDFRCDLSSTQIRKNWST